MTSTPLTTSSPETHKKILIVRVGALGDVLHALPAVAALRHAQPGWQIDWVVDPRWAPLLVDVDGQRRGPVVSGIHLADVKLWKRSPASLATLRSLRTLRRALRREHYDLVVDMQGTLRSAIIGRMAGAPVFAGYADPREPHAAWLYNRKLIREAPHVVTQGAELLGQAVGPAAAGLAANRLAATGLALSPFAPELPHESWADEWANQEASHGKLCLLAPGAGWGAKRWPAANFGAVAHELHAQGYDVVVTASREDDPLAAEVIAASRDDSGQPTVRMLVCNVSGLLALTRRAALVIGGDSGPTHLAAALGAPLVALFGPTDPARNGPWGPGPMRVLRDPSSLTSHKRVAEVEPGLGRISVASVLAAVQDMSLTTRHP